MVWVVYAGCLRRGRDCIPDVPSRFVLCSVGGGAHPRCADSARYCFFENCMDMNL